MGPEIVFAPSAFKHGVSEADIRWTVRTLICDVLIDEYEDKYAIIGFDTKGNMTEIMYNLINDQLIKVFHAMRCRESFYKKYGIKGENHG
ncbi:MAG: hypothetical protein LBQ69_01850 [Treponema sp.]|jgi:uncharacterized DUF497 family protein|nr:hypothetical protein [Treponema sp.]